MIDLHLVQNIRAKDVPMEPIRKGFGRGLLAAGEKDENVVGACADLTNSTAMNISSNSSSTLTGAIYVPDSILTIRIDQYACVGTRGWCD